MKCRRERQALKAPQETKKAKTPKPKADYDVGYCKPPEKHQFKKGNKANVNGRPKGSKNLSTIANEIMDAKIAIQKNGTQTKVSTKEALLWRLFSQALAGDRGAMRDALNFMLKMTGMNAADPAGTVVSPLPPDAMHDVLRDFLAHAVEVGDEDTDALQTELETEGEDR
ncbi:DUF5681 domain-containing protein [Mesorhizobium sp. 10J20-29]